MATMKRMSDGNSQEVPHPHRRLRIHAHDDRTGRAEAPVARRPAYPYPQHRHRTVRLVFLFNLTLVAAFLTILPGCGYHFSGEGLGPKPELRKIAIPVFENNTSEAGLEGRFTAALRNEFILRSQLQLVPVEEAEAIFHGRITNISASRVAQRGVQQTIESRLFITVNIRCVEVKTGRVIWQDPQYTYYRTFSQPGSGADPALLYENRRKAEEFLAEEMAVRIHDRFLANF